MGSCCMLRVCIWRRYRCGYRSSTGYRTHVRTLTVQSSLGMGVAPVNPSMSRSIASLMISTEVSACVVCAGGK